MTDEREMDEPMSERLSDEKIDYILSWVNEDAFLPDELHTEEIVFAMATELKALRTPQNVELSEEQKKFWVKRYADLREQTNMETAIPKLISEAIGKPHPTEGIDDECDHPYALVHREKCLKCGKYLGD